MTIGQFKKLLSAIDDSLEVEVPFILPMSTELKNYEPFLLRTGDDYILILPKPLEKFYLEECLKEEKA